MFSMIRAINVITVCLAIQAICLLIMAGVIIHKHRAIEQSESHVKARAEPEQR
jgi:hypothetical protein